jgi:hypothetical protein
VNSELATYDNNASIEQENELEQPAKDPDEENYENQEDVTNENPELGQLDKKKKTPEELIQKIKKIEGDLDNQHLEKKQF